MKKCFKCGIEKELDEFYKHPQMGDGHLNKCKECTKNDVRQDYERKSKDVEWFKRERERGREKYHRLNYKDAERTIRRKSLFWMTNEYKGLRKWASKKIILTETDELHHWNYNKIKDFFVLSKRAHKLIHKYMQVNEETGLYITKNGVVLDTKTKHFNFILNILESKGYKRFSIGVYNFTN